MKVVCVYCAVEGKPTLIGEKEPFDDPRVTHGVCATHRRRLGRTAKKSSQQAPPRVPEPASPDPESIPIGPFPLRDRNYTVATRGSVGPLTPMPKPIVYLCRGSRTWLLSQDLADDEGVRPHFIATQLHHDADVETALRVAQAEFPDYDIRVLNWHRPKRD